MYIWQEHVEYVFEIKFYINSIIVCVNVMEVLKRDQTVESDVFSNELPIPIWSVWPETLVMTQFYVLCSRETLANNKFWCKTCKHSCYKDWRLCNRTDNIRNKEILLRVRETRNLIQSLTMRKRKWIGYILRGDSLKIRGFGKQSTGRSEKIKIWPL